MEKEEIQILIDESMKTVTDTLAEFKTEAADVRTAAAAAGADFEERMKALEEGDTTAIDAKIASLEELKDSLRGFDFAALDTRIASLEGLVERLETVESFSKAFGEDFDFAKLEERIVAIEDMPLVKGIITLPPEGMADIHAKIGEFNSFEEGARFIRGLQP